MQVIMLVCVIVLVNALLVQSQQLPFVSLGDWGWINNDSTAVANQIGISAAAVNAVFLIAAGDNFYLDGVANDTDPQWETKYRNVYTAKSLDIPWRAISGNHDHHYGRSQGEIDYYMNKRDSRWFYPYYWYRLQEVIPGTSTTVDFIYIDTVIWSGVPCTQCRHPQHTAAESLHWYQTQRDAQISWFNATLGNSTADWIIVIGHYPVYSGGEHGDTDYLVRELRPLLVQYDVDLYLCGHDHTLQHLRDTVNGTQYLVSGNGAWRGTYTPIKQSVFGVVDPGFMTHILTEKTLVSTAIDYTGKTVYQYTQTRLQKSRGYKTAKIRTTSQ